MTKLIQILFISVIFALVTTNSSYANKYDRNKKEGKKYLFIMAGYVPAFDADIEFTALPGFSNQFSYDSSFTLGGGLGYYLGENLRVEGEITYRQSKVESLTISGITLDWEEDIKLWNWMLNTYYSIPVHDKIAPYIGGGFGFSHDSAVNGENAYAYQGMLGVDFDVDYSSAISVGYRYFGTGEFEDLRVVGTGRSKIKQNIFEASYRIKF